MNDTKQSELLETFSLIKNRFDEDRAEYNKQRTNSLISICRLTGARKSVIDKIIKNGIPKCIMVGAGIPADIYDLLSFIAPVCKLSVALTNDQIIFSWVENFDSQAASNVNY